MQHTFFLVSKKTTFHMLHTFLYISLPFFTSYLHVLRRKCLCCVLPVRTVFSLPLIFMLVATSISHSLTAATWFSCFSCNKIGVCCYLFLALALSLLSKLTNVDIKIKWKERLIFLLFVFSSLKVWVAMWFTAETSGVLEMQTFTSAITYSFLDGHDSWLPSRSPRVCTVSVRSYGDVMTNFSWIDGLPN